MPKPLISFTTRKALEVQLGEEAGREVASILQRMADALATLEKKKVDVTPIAPAGSTGVLAFAQQLVAND